MFASDRRIPLLLALVTALAMIAITGWQAYRFWQAESHPASVQAEQPAAGNQRSGPAVPRVELASLSLFGTRSASGETEVTDTENLPETNLRLSLRGVLAADGDFPGSALIEDEKSQTEAYLVGDELPGNARLRTVFANRVVIERAGKLENLYFPEDDDRSGVDLASNNASAEPAPQSEEPPRQAAPSPAPASSESDQQRREEIRQRLEQLRQRLQNNN